jgi:hypothetical protein
MKNTWILIVLCLGVLAGCETIHTGILGDIPTGMKPSSALNQGQVYKDPQGRFEVMAPDDRNLVPRRTVEGVVLEGKAMDRGDVGYAVLVYPVPGYMTGSDEETLRQSFSGLKSKMLSVGANVQVIEQFGGNYKGHPALDVYYAVRPKGSTYILYVARFVKVKSRVYNMYYYYAAGYWPDVKDLTADFIKKIHLPYAEKLYDGVTFLSN